ncbi:MAG: hypothetical protein ACSHWZ_04220 [Sulfitobacter sp.]
MAKYLPADVAQSAGSNQPISLQAATIARFGPKNGRFDRHAGELDQKIAAWLTGLPKASQNSVSFAITVDGDQIYAQDLSWRNNRRSIAQIDPHINRKMLCLKKSFLPQRCPSAARQLQRRKTLI